MDLKITAVKSLTDLHLLQKEVMSLKHLGTIEERPHPTVPIRDIYDRILRAMLDGRKCVVVANVELCEFLVSKEPYSDRVELREKILLNEPKVWKGVEISFFSYETL